MKRTNNRQTGTTGHQPFNRCITLLLMIVFAATLPVACKKFLDTKPTDSISPENYYKTQGDLNRALAGVYDRLGDRRVYGTALYGYFAFSDEFFIKGQSTGYLANIIDASTLEVNRCWEAIYTGIERANMLLDYIGNAQVTDSFRNEIKGQALFLRGYYYYLLADMFGAVPLKLTSTKSPVEPPLSRTPVAQVYAQVVADMKAAEPLVKDITSYGFNGRVTKTAVQGMLAKVYLTMAGNPLKDQAKYADARAYADKVIQSKIHSLNTSYQQIFINHAQDLYDIKEGLWEVEFYGNNQEVIKEGGYVGSWIGIACTNIDTGYGYDYIHATAKLYNAYGANDLRRDWNVAPYRFVATGNTVVRTAWTSTQIYERSAGKWRREYEVFKPKNKDYTPTNFPLLRYSDVLLMFAEAENQVNGPTGAAYDAVNMVRRRAYGKPLTTADATVDLPAGLSKTDFLDSLKNERFRELAFEGVRKHDLIRWGDYLPVMKDMIVQYQATAPSTLSPAAIIQAQNVTQRSLLMPVPNSEIAVNPYVTQNPGW